MKTSTNSHRDRAERATAVARRIVAIGAAILVASAAVAQSPPTLEQIRDAYPAASHAPKLQQGWEALTSKVETEAPRDEAGNKEKGAKTEQGTPLQFRIEACFPTEMRNLFYQVDMVPTGPDGKLQPVNYLGSDGKISDDARKAIRGQNTWMLWGEGNEAFWGWLQQNGYGLADFLILIDSRQRDHRFRDAGLVNQPGMKTQTDPGKKILGLYIDQADGNNIVLKQPPNDIDSKTDKLAVNPSPPPSHADKKYTQLFEPGDPGLYNETIAKLPKDGVDPNIYGYPSGIVGLRLLPNPDFFGNTDAAKAARGYWQSQVIEQGDDNYYTDAAIHADPNLVRPFRVSMSCGFCHVGPHPLSPPADPEKPEWGDLSSTIGNQYWTPPKAFSNLKRSNSFLYQFVASQQPGTIDTSLVSTDHINNANTINAIFDVPARLARAKKNQTEKQNALNLLVRGIEDAQPGANPRHTPRVLLDGSDSIGVEGALARVYLNIGAYSEQWKHLHNPVIGFKPQRPFALPTIKAQSVYWNTTEKYRVPQLEAFFTYENKGVTVTQPMKLAQVRDKAVMARVAAAAPDVAGGRDVFLRNCAVCHSSKQPEGFTLAFSRDWKKASQPKAGETPTYTLPMDFAEWEDFKRSDAFGDFKRRILDLADTKKPEGRDFFNNNFLSTDIRIPITLVGTNSGRAVATNGMRGQVWDNFSSETYKELPAVGAVRFYNPYLKFVNPKAGIDHWGNNDAYAPPGGGPGYYRPASLISLWATAPLLHNNALGVYTQDPSFDGRLQAYDDAIDKLLMSREERFAQGTHRPGDLRTQYKALEGEPGFIYRTTTRSWIDFPGVFIKPLLAGVLGESVLSFLTLYLWLILAAIAVLLIFIGQPRQAGFALALFAVVVAVVVRYTAVDSVYPRLWWIPAIAVAGALLFWFLPHTRAVARVFFALVAAGLLAVAGVATAFVDGKLADLKVGPIPKGTPVNLIMNMNPEAPPLVMIEAASGLTRGILRIRKDGLTDTNGAALAAFEEEAGLALLKASKCPDFVLDRGHWFGEGLSKDEKRQLKAFMQTL